MGYILHMNTTTAPTGSHEDTAHYCLDKAELAIETDQMQLARQLLGQAVVAYSQMADPIGRANAAARQARVAAKWLDHETGWQAR